MRFACVFISCAAMIGGHRDGKAQVKDVRDPSHVLRFLAASSKANFERITTLKGVYAFEERLRWAVRLENHEDQPCWKVSRADLSFSADFRNGDFSCYFKPTAPPYLARTADGRRLSVKLQPFEAGVVVTSKSYQKYDPMYVMRGLAGAKEAPSSRALVSINAPAESDRYRNASFVFDVEDLFGYQKIKTWERIGGYLKLAEGTVQDRSLFDEHVHVRSKTQDGSRTISVNVKLGPSHAGDKTRFRTALVFDEKAGYNPISWSGQKIVDDRAVDMDQVAWSYEKIRDVFVPSRYVLRKFDGDGALQFERSLRLASVDVNGGLDATEFSMAKFPLKNGDLVRDELKDQDYLWENGRLKETDELRPSRHTKDASIFRSGLFVVVLVSGNALLLIAICYLRWRRSSNSKRAVLSGPHEN